MSYKIRVSLNVSIQTIFLTLSILLAGLLTWYNYAKSTDAALVIAEDLLSEVNETILREMRLLFKPVQVLGRTLPAFPDIAVKPEGTSHPMQEAFISALDDNKYIYSMYLGWADGDFYQVIKVRGQEGIRESLRAPPGTQYALRHIASPRAQGPRVQSWSFLDNALVRLGGRTETAEYDPRKRPWYKSAEHRDRIIKTKLYVFSSTKSLGTTIACRFKGATPGVLGIDMTLDAVSSFLGQQQLGKGGQTFIFAANGQITGHADPGQVTRAILDREGNVRVFPARVGDIDDPVVSAIYEQYVSGRDLDRSVASCLVRGRRFLFKLTPLYKGFGSQEFVAVAAPEEYFTGPITATRSRSLFFSVLILAGSVLLIMFASRHISRPLNALVAEAERIRGFDLDGPVNVRSRIKEVNNLSLAVGAMKTALRNFTQYVPRDLVRRLVQSGAQPVLGGERRELTLLFTDITDFTTIAEPMGPEKLVQMLSQYFQTLGSIISEHDGTIDKFIGDAIMAFWNAPEHMPDHTLKACEAALRCARSAVSDRFCTQSGECRLLSTRFGLYRGETVVGNVGSADRLNYTAIGSAVNIASRLEALNKYYGTAILTNQAVRDHTSDMFVFRPVDMVLPKGVLTPFPIYELLGARPESGLDDIAVSPEEVARGKGFEAAYGLYRDKRWADAALAFEALSNGVHDRLLGIYVERTKRFAIHDPGPAWRGVKEFDTK